MKGAVLVVVVVMAIASPARIAYAQSGAAGPRLEGDWVRIDPDGAGSFGGLAASIPTAQLLPGVTAGAGRGGRGGGGGRGGRGGADCPR